MTILSYFTNRNKKVLKTKKGEWVTKNLISYKNEIINAILDERTYFFIPYDFDNPKKSKHDKFLSRMIERHDLEQMSITTLIQFLNKIQEKHSKMLGIDITNYKVKQVKE